MSNTGKRLTKRQLNKILGLHVKWLSGYRGGARADLTGVDLRRTSLRGVNLRNADLSYANLSGADLRDAHLAEAQLRGADLRDADMHGANLRFADLRGADMTGADMRGADLYGTLLEGVKFPNPILDLSNCKVGYKKVWSSDYSEQLVIELRFPEGAQLVSTLIGRKCRASEAVVVRCVTPGSERLRVFRSYYNLSFLYRTGETVKPTEPFDNSITVECTSGIHFFTTREEAERYVG